MPSLDAEYAPWDYVLRQYFDRDLRAFDDAKLTQGNGKAAAHPAMTISRLVSSLALSKTVAVSDKAAQLKGSVHKKTAVLSAFQADEWAVPEPDLITKPNTGECSSSPRMEGGALR